MERFDDYEQTKLFAGIPRSELPALLSCLNARQRVYEKGETVLWEGDAVKEVGVVLWGNAHSVKQEPTGKTVLVSLLQPGSFIGVLLAGSRQRNSPVSVQAVTGLCVLFVPFERLIGRCGRLCECHTVVLANFIDGIAEKALHLHDRNDCLIKPTVREKISTYLAQVAKHRGSIAFEIPLDRNAMAQYLNVERSSLSRALSQMQQEGLLQYHKNSFVLLK